MAIVSVRPYSPYLPLPPALPKPDSKLSNGGNKLVNGTNDKDEDASSETSYDPLFDEEPEDNPARNQTSNATHMGDTRLSTISSQKTAGNPRGPPVLDSETYGTFSSDVLMTASVDGSVVLWDRRVNSPGKGVGRLETNSKTPPWCVSVR